MKQENNQGDVTQHEISPEVDSFPITPRPGAVYSFSTTAPCHRFHFYSLKNKNVD